MALPGSYNITIYQGDTYKKTFGLKDGNGVAIDLTGQTPKAQIRVNQASSSVLLEFTAALETQAGATLGQVTISATHADTAALTPADAYGVWDLQLTNGSGVVTTYIGGKASVVAEVTR